MAVAIDFTASNGEPSEPASLHRMTNAGELNTYEKAITQVGSILEEYSF